MENLKDKLADIAALVDGWATTGEIDEIERDIALEMLRELYRELKFPAEPVPAEEPAAESQTTEPEQVTNEPEPEIEVELEAEIEVEPEVVVVIEEEPVAEIEPEPVATVEEPEPEIEKFTAPLPPPQGARCELPGNSKNPESEPEHQIAEPQRVIVPETARKPSAEPLPHRKVAPELIRSLYGPDPAPNQPQTTAKNGHTSAHSHHSGHIGGHNSGHTSGHDRHHEKSEKNILGDTLKNHQSLRKSIGLNDRFLMIRDMFRGDGAAFDLVINKLDSFDSLDDAIIHIHDTYDWNADTEAVKRLVELLERRYSK